MKRHKHCRVIACKDTGELQRFTQMAARHKSVVEGKVSVMPIEKYTLLYCIGNSYDTGAICKCIRTEA